MRLILHYINAKEISKIISKERFLYLLIIIFIFTVFYITIQWNLGKKLEKNDIIVLKNGFLNLF